MGCSAAKAEEQAAAELAELSPGGQSKVLSGTAEGATKQRRSSRGSIVSNNSFTGSQELASYVKPVYAKNPGTRERIRQALREHGRKQALFGHLVGKDLEDVIDAFYHIDAFRGQDIITQGSVGLRLYVLFRGEVDVFVRSDWAGGPVLGDKGPKVATLGPYSLFGELALLYSRPPVATVTISSEVAELWALDREPFNMLLMRSSLQHDAVHKGWVSQVDLFKGVDGGELSRLDCVMGSKHYEVGEVIIRQGDPADAFYLLEMGTCAAYISSFGGEEREVKRYERQGDYFGELALLKDQPRNATVRAIEPHGATVAILPRADFERLLGPLRETFKAHVEQYSASGMYDMRSLRDIEDEWSVDI